MPGSRNIVSYTWTVTPVSNARGVVLSSSNPILRIPRDVPPDAYRVVLTTYDMVTAEDWEELRIIRWACVIVDEAQRMK